MLFVLGSCFAKLCWLIIHLCWAGLGFACLAWLVWACLVLALLGPSFAEQVRLCLAGWPCWSKLSWGGLGLPGLACLVLAGLVLALLGWAGPALLAGLSLLITPLLGWPGLCWLAWLCWSGLVWWVGLGLARLALPIWTWLVWPGLGWATLGWLVEAVAKLFCAQKAPQINTNRPASGRVSFLLRKD